MTRGFYAATAAMMSDIERFDTVANNLANVNTHGYKRHQTLHHDFQQGFVNRIQTAQMRLQTNDKGQLERDMVTGGPQMIGHLGTGTFVTGNWTHFDEGALEETQSPFDMAIKGDGFFCYEGPDGETRYTRNGHFKISGQGGMEGQLVTAEGFPVLGEGGPITLDPTARFTVDAQGHIFSNGQEIDQIKLVRFERPQNLLNEGANSYTKLVDQEELPVNDARDPKSGAEIAQGFLEQSNVNVASQMVEMISAMRSYQASQKALQSEDDMTGRLINDVGRS
ncbi:MAG: flagellar basal-body rod protein FlgF [Candidatus Sericytochromatia bacterium]